MKKSIIYTNLFLLAVNLSPVTAMEDEERDVPPQRNSRARDYLDITFVGAFEHHGNVQAPNNTLRNPQGLVNQGIIETSNEVIY